MELELGVKVKVNKPSSPYHDCIGEVVSLYFDGHVCVEFIDHTCETFEKKHILLEDMALPDYVLRF